MWHFSEELVTWLFVQCGDSNLKNFWLFLVTDTKTLHSCIFVQDKEQTVLDEDAKMHHTHAWETDFSKMLLWDFKIIRKNIYCENISPSWSLLVHHHARYICQTVTDISHDSHGDVKRILPAAWSTGGGTSSSALVTLPQITSTDTAAPRGVGCSSMFFLDIISW